MSSNYPDDIGNYNHDPRSPFYESGPECSKCGEEMALEQDADEDGYYTTMHCLNVECTECADYEGLGGGM